MLPCLVTFVRLNTPSEEAGTVPCALTVIVAPFCESTGSPWESVSRPWALYCSLTGSPFCKTVSVRLPSGS